MNELPINPLAPEEQQKVMEQMYWLCGKQVQSYHKHRHMGNNSSVPAELAQELMESIVYTIDLVGGVCSHRNIEEALLLGQEILKSRLNKAKSMLELVKGTAPQWQTECRCEALRYLQHYLEEYDYLHLAHKGPEDLFYPILISPPEGIKGIDSCIFYSNILWIENQIMGSVPEETQERLWDRLPVGTLNQCEQLLINGVGKILIEESIDQLTFEPDSRETLIHYLLETTEEKLYRCTKILCSQLNLSDEYGKKYIEAIIPQLISRTAGNINAEQLKNIFL